MARWATDDPNSGAVDQVEMARRAGIPMKTSGSCMVDGKTYHYGPEDVADLIGYKWEKQGGKSQDLKGSYA